MAIRVSCGECFSQFSAKSSHIGKRVRCPECGAAVVVGNAEPSRHAAPAPRPSSRSQQRRLKSSRSGGNGLLIGLGVGGGVLVLAVGVVAAFLIGRSSSNRAPGDVAATNATTEATDATVEDSSVAALTPTTASTPQTPSVEVAPVDIAADPAAAIPAVLPGDNVSAASTVEGAVTASEPANDDGLPPLPDEDLSLPDLIDLVEKSVVRIHVNGEYGGSTGSGFVVDKEGTIVTNYHVMEGALSAEAEFNTGEKVPIKGFWTLDDVLDLAIVKVDMPGEKLHPIRLATSLPRSGISVAAFGAPLGLSFSASEGVISATRKASEVGQEQGTYLQTTTPISPGNSGGPLVNMRGEVVGANTFKRADGENINFAVSSPDILAILEKKGQQLGQISPQTIPVKISGGYGGVEDLSGTERGSLLLSQIRDAVVVIQPFSYDPTGRIADFLETSAERAILERAGWQRVRTRSQIRGSTAIVVVVTYFRVGEETTDDNLVSEVVIDMTIMARDVDRGGTETLAIVWRERDGVGTTSLRSLLDGRVTRTVQTGVNGFFGGFLNDYRKAVRAAESP